MSQRHPLVAVFGMTATGIERTSGRILWKYTTRAIIGRIALVADRIFLLDDMCQLHCLAAGCCRGVVPMDKPERSACSLLVDGDVLFVATTRSIIAVSGQGQILWRTEDVGATGGLRSGLAVPGNVSQPDFVGN